VFEDAVLYGDDKIYKIRYSAEATKYNKYELAANRISSSIQYDIPILTYKNPSLGLEMQYPYNWMKNIRYKQNTLGTDKKDNLLFSISFQSPVVGPLSLIKEYRMVIGYDSSYGQQRPYEIAFKWHLSNNTWLRTIEESPLQGKFAKIIDKKYYNSTPPFEKGTNYITYNVDLESLNLPDQFYVSFAAGEGYLRNGLLCVLTDSTDFISVPPPHYSISANPSSINDMRPGDERDVLIQINSPATLPFHISLSPEQRPGLELTFRPNEMSGVPGGISTSTLHIKALTNATKQSHITPIKAKILLTSPGNFNNSTSANISQN
jgi:hypothetical protein